jgi:hypothetical protein
MVKHSVESISGICHSESPLGDEESKLQILHFAPHQSVQGFVQDDSFVAALLRFCLLKHLSDSLSE